jgi:ER membrane protein complex subunit 1
MRYFYRLGLILAAFSSMVAALHQSDVGALDWYQPYVGVPLTSSLSTAPAFHNKAGRLPTEALLLMATSSNVLAALHASNGSLGTCQLCYRPP